MTALPSPLRLGPMLRHVDDHSATIWVQTAEAATVTVRAEEHSASAHTFACHGFHYALVIIEGLTEGTAYRYTLDIDGERAWPDPASSLPPSTIHTLKPERPTRLAFGSCRTSDPHDEEGNNLHGVDALRAYAVRMIEEDDDLWPDLLIFLGDQVYADEETPTALREFIEQRRGLDEPPGEEIKDYVEYDYLYQLAWSDPVVRWLLSTVPSAMIFDDHDVRDDWNTSWSWQQEIRETEWWQERIVAALASYWVYQHIGNLSPESLAKDALWQQISARGEGEELDITTALDELADRADKDPSTYRWSYTRNLGESRLIMIDSRAARELHPDRRSMLDADEMAWLDGQMRGDCRHLFIGTSLPFLLPPGLHDFEAMNEVMAQHGWGPRLGRLAERVRQTIDLEHWAAFNDGFGDVFEMVMAIGRGERGQAPAMITFLSGDVHNSYLAEVTNPGQHGSRSHIAQAVCSPMRNPMPRGIRVFMSLFAKSLVRPMRLIAGRSQKVPDPAFPWTVTNGPWFDNNLAIAEVDGRGLRLAWWSGQVEPGCDPERPTLREVYAVRVG